LLKAKFATPTNGEVFVSDGQAVDGDVCTGLSIITLLDGIADASIFKGSSVD
jgi:hypothetical protein